MRQLYCFMFSLFFASSISFAGDIHDLFRAVEQNNQPTVEYWLAQDVWPFETVDNEYVWQFAMRLGHEELSIFLSDYASYRAEEGARKSLECAKKKQEKRELIRPLRGRSLNIPMAHSN